MNDQKLDFWINSNYNVLIKGGHGVGKTSIIAEAFARNNLKWLYFSAPTMDPWVDFIGVPKELTNEKGEKYLGLIRPEVFQNDEVEAIFFDEFNRAPAKVRNAVMELLQFKSINGKKFNNLKIIWAAINPDEDENGEESDEYNVERLDPAQKDRFHIIIDANNTPSLSYFKNKYGANGKIAVTWWNSLDKEFKKEISPRRLDYILDVYTRKGDITDVVSKKISTVQLLQQLDSGLYIDNFKELLAEKNYDELTLQFKNINFYDGVINYVIKNKLFNEVGKCLQKENISNLIATNDSVRSSILNNKDMVEEYKDILASIVSTKGLKKKIINEINNVLPKQIKDISSKDISSIDNWINTNYKENNRGINVFLTTVCRDKIIKEFNSMFSTYKESLTQDQLVKLTAIISVVRGRTQGNLKPKHKKSFDILQELCKKYNYSFNDVLEDALKSKCFKVFNLSSTTHGKIYNDLNIHPF